MITNFLLCASGAVIDKKTNNLSLFNIIEDIHVIGFPAFIQKFDVVWAIRKEENDEESFDGKLLIKNNSHVLAEGSLHVNFHSKSKNRTIININGMPIPEPGFILIQVYKNDILQAENIMNIYQLSGPQIVQEDAQNEGELPAVLGGSP